MDLNRAYDQLIGGTSDVPGTLAGFQGLVNPSGWDFGQVAQDVPNDYLINSPLLVGSTFTATLDWFRAPEKVAALQQRFTVLHDELRRDTPTLCADAIQNVLES